MIQRPLISVAPLSIIVSKIPYYEEVYVFEFTKYSQTYILRPRFILIGYAYWECLLTDCLVMLAMAHPMTSSSRRQMQT